jgi:hypothetical protein
MHNCFVPSCYTQCCCMQLAQSASSCSASHAQYALQYLLLIKPQNVLLCLQDFGGAALTAKFSATGLTQSKVFNSLSLSGELKMPRTLLHCTMSCHMPLYTNMYGI